MSTVPLHDPTLRAGVQATVVVAGGAAADVEQAVQLLRAAGIAIEPHPGTSSQRILLLVESCPAAARVERIRAAAEAGAGTTIVATMPEEAGSGVLRRALRAGADGIVFDGELGCTLVPTLRAVWAGQLAVPPRLRRQIAPRHLSYREKQILSLVVVGYTNRQIADKLILAESTIKTHLSSAFAKLDARSRAEAAALVLDPEEGYDLAMAPVAGEAAAPAA
jgi:DNA-binding NarL/FixJ family response regulator